MNSDTEILKQIEKKIGKGLKFVLAKDSDNLGGSSKVLSRNGNKVLNFETRKYKLNKNGNVTNLNLSNLELYKLPAELQELTDLLEVDLAWNKVSELPENISCLTNLQSLTLTRNPISTLPHYTNKLRNLKRLDLRDCGFVRIPDEVFELINLEILLLNSQQIFDLHFNIGKLKNLRVLDLANCQFTHIPEGIFALSKLEELNFGNDVTLGPNSGQNKISIIPREIKGLLNLRRLNLNGNRIENVPDEIAELPQLIDLDLSGNLLTTIPAKILKLKKLQRIALYDNPLSTPPLEIAEQGLKAIREYFSSLEGEEIPLNEVKVLLIGDGGAGKTSLVKQLFRQKFDRYESQTHGIRITNGTITSKGKQFRIHFWDFGGQEIMHATHQFFLSKRSLYILVLDGRKDEKTEYWLKHINSFGGDSPVLIVMNKVDQHPAFDVNRIFLQKKYKNIKGFYRVSCATQRGITIFRKALCKTLASVELIQTIWPKSWFNVKTSLERMKMNFVSYDEYQKICEKKHITEQSAQDTLADFLNDLGVILHFRDFDLLDTHVLEPKWVTEAVYKIINSEQLAQCKGILQLSLLHNILKQRQETEYYYPRNKYRYIIDLMKKFELCYEIDKNAVLIPDLLEIQEPPFSFDYDTSLQFLFEYDFLPHSIMPRFIVRLHKDIKDDLRWRTGVVLEDEDLKAIATVKVDYEAKRIYIYVHGEQRRDYFSIIRRTFRDIHKSFEQLITTELIPLPEHKNITVEYHELMGYELDGRDEFFIGKLRKVYSVKKLLNGIEKEEERKKKGEHHIINVQGNYYEHSQMEVDTMGDKHIGRDEVTISGNANVSQFTTGAGDSFQGDYAQKLLQTTSQQSPREEIINLLSFVQHELPKLPLPEETKEEIANEVKGAEIQAKKDKPDKEKMAGKLKNATEALKEGAKTIKEAVMIGNLLGKAITWCGEQWIEWMI